MNIYQILETLKRVEESSAQVGDRVSCPNNITGTIVADAGSSWVIIDDHAETEDDRLEFRKSDCTPIAMSEGQMKHHMWDMAERLSLEQFLDMFPDSEDFYLGVHGVDSREELDQNDWERDHPEIHDTDDLPSDHVYRSGGDPYDRPEPQSEGMDDDDGGYVDDPTAHATVNRAGFNKLTPQSYADKIDFIDRQLADPRQQQNWPEFKQRRLDLMTAAQRAGIVKEGGKFQFANAKQRPGDQVRGTEKAVSKKDQHPFKGRLVGTDEDKLDEKCWDGYQQQGMKKKGDRQVPNCVAVEEEYEAYMNELVGTYGMTSGGTATGGNTNTQAGQEIDTITKNLRDLKSKVPDLNIQKATAALSKADDSDPLSSQDKDAASALADPVANLIKDPQLGQQLQQLISKGMQKDQAAAQLAKQQGGA